MNKNSKLYIAGHKGMVGSAILRRYKSEGHKNIFAEDYPQKIWR